MKIRSLKYHLEQGAKSITKNRLMSFASIICVSVCSFLLIVSLCIAINLDSALEKIEESIGISIYLGEQISDEEVKELFTEIEKVDYVSNIFYMSKDDALTWAKEEWGDENDILAGLEGDNPFPRSFEVRIEGAKYQKQVIESIEKLQNSFEAKLIETRKAHNSEMKEMLENTLDETQISEPTSQITTQANKDLPKANENETNITETQAEIQIGKDGYEYIGIEKIKHSQKQSDILLAINNTIRFVSIILLIILSTISVAIIVNTIKLTVYVRRTEINIMKYVGATDWFIRWPFVIEGIIIGLIGALIPITICILSYDKINSFIYERLPIIQSYIEFKSGFEIFLFIAPATLLLGVILGVIGSVNSIKKYLNV